MIPKGFGSGSEHGRKDLSQKIEVLVWFKRWILGMGKVFNICHCLKQGILEEASETFCFPVPKYLRFPRKNADPTYLKVLPRVSYLGNSSFYC